MMLTIQALFGGQTAGSKATENSAHSMHGDNLKEEKETCKYLI
jgi:hypothetical protein